MVEFTSIAPDHGIEHENRKLKVLGGIISITQNEKSLEKVFLISPELSTIVGEFGRKCGIDKSTSKKQYHELSGGKLARQTKNTSILLSFIKEHGNPFEDSDDLFNILTKSIVDDDTTKDILG